MLDAWQTVWVCVVLSVLVLALDAWFAGRKAGIEKVSALAEKRALRQKQLRSGGSVKKELVDGVLQRGGYGYLTFSRLNGRLKCLVAP